jgi:hypothetical protein
MDYQLPSLVNCSSKINYGEKGGSNTEVTMRVNYDINETK